ncbi:MAG: hypothetical protein K5873_07070 [Treponema sp.]|nr:hypothetical protein [Treponema sp.]
MKVPENFNASATKKINPIEAAINGNFAQNTPSEPRESLSQAQAALSDEKSSADLKSPLTGKVQSQNLNAATEKSPADQVKTPVRREVKEKFLVSMSKGERSVFKAFCAMQNVSMNHFVMCAMDYFKEDLENGKVSLSAHSYKRKES